MKFRARFRKTLAAFSAAVIAAAGLPALAAPAVSAAETTPEGYITKNINYMNSHKAVIQELYEGIYAHESEIDISSYKIPLSEAGTLYSIVTDIYPELFYLQLEYYTYYYNDSSGNSYIYSINPQYKYTEEDVADMRIVFDQKTEWFLRNVDSSMTDFEKALILHDELVLNSEYELNGGTYEILADNRGRCYGYAEVYAFLLAQVGVKTEIVTSDAMAHAWVKVCIDGTYYNVDVTWDDPATDRPGLVQHKYFLLSDAKIQSFPQSDGMHYSYDTDFASDSRFDDANFRGVTSGFKYVDGALYGMYNTSDSQYSGSIVRYSPVSDSLEIIKTFIYTWYADGGYYYSDGFSSLDYYDGLFYYNSPDAVYTFDLSADKTAVFAQNTYGRDFYGMRIVDGNVYGAISSDANTAREMVYLGEAIKNSETLMLGDVDKNGVLNIRDATEIQRKIAEIIRFDSAQTKAADYDGDGKITISDVTAIQVYIASH